MKKKHALTLILMVLVPIIFFTLRDLGLFKLEDVKKERRCRNEESAMEKSLHGEITDKYVDRKNHNFKTIVIGDKTGMEKTSTILATDVSGLFDKLEIGDYIVKESGSLKVVFANKIRQDSIILDYNCSGIYK